LCGIIGYTGPREALPVLVDGLSRLEYRGYDSAGIAVLGDGVLAVEKCEGRLSRLVSRIHGGGLPGRLGIGHTRWATHGRPSDANAHPHQDCHRELALVHNGIVENYLELKMDLERRGHSFTSETDTEVIAHLIEEKLRGSQGGLDVLAAAVRATAAELQGAFALAVVWRRAPEGLVAVRQDNPLIVGFGDRENFVASDIPALLPYTRVVSILRNGDLAIVGPDRVEVTDLDGRPRRLERTTLDLGPEQAELGRYRHFMEKEIFEQPQALSDALRGRLEPSGGKRGPAGAGRFLLPELDALVAGTGLPGQVALVACGTAYHAGLIGRALLERLGGITSRAEIASEFRYSDPLLGRGDLLVAISQSGETTDTLGALREGIRKGASTLGVVNVVGSSVAREAGGVLYTRAGPEIAVASTKAYTTQIAVLTLIALRLAEIRARTDPALLDAAAAALRQLPGLIEKALEQSAAIEEYAGRLARREDAFFIGRGLDYAVCLEGQLKLKEISYIHAEAYPGGELKHGTLALIQKGVPVVALVTQPDLEEKMISNIREVAARGGAVTAFVRSDLAGSVRPHVDRVIPVPVTVPWLQPVLAAAPFQLLAYHAAVHRGCDVDKPRNLAKSVTVE